MKVKKIISIIMVLCVIFVLSGCSEGSSNAPAEDASNEELVFKFGHVLAPDHPYNLGAEKFKEILEANAPQPVRVEVFHSSQLGSERDLTEGLQLGTVDLALVPGTIASFEPKMKLFSLPFLFNDEEHAHKVLDGEVGSEIAADLPSKGLRLLAYWENGFRNVTNSKKPINTPDDLKGLKIRVPEDKIYVETFTAWGSNPVTMSFGELYTALQQKTIDAQENPLAIIYTNKFNEIQGYLSLTKHIYGTAPLLISEITWNKLSPEMQSAIQSAAEQARDYERQLLAEKNATYLKELEAAGMKINDVNVESFNKTTESIYAPYVGEFGQYIEKIRNAK
ncbi:MAG: DctP family TRAP transporter solute-binding subunit [Sedimentibacter sp.]